MLSSVDLEAGLEGNICSSLIPRSRKEGPARDKAQYPTRSLCTPKALIKVNVLASIPSDSSLSSGDFVTYM